MKLLLMALMCLFFSNTLDASIKKVNETQIDETKHILTALPTHLVPIDDSMLYFTSQGDKCIWSNYITGEVKKIYKMDEIINTNYLAHLLNIDTLESGFIQVKKQWSEMGLKEIQIEAITKYDDRNVLLIADVNFPKLVSIDGDDSVFSGEKKPFYFILNNQDLSIQKIDTLDVKWEPKKRHFEAAIFGLSVFNDTIYIGKSAFSDYDGNIFSAYSKNDFSRLNIPINIYHKPYQNTNNLPTVSYFKIYKYGNKAFVCNRSEIYDLSSQKLIFDLSKYDNNIQNISFLVPVDKQGELFFIYYSTSYDSNLKEHPKYTAYFNLSSKTITDRKPAFASIFQEYGKKIISIEKREENYVYVIYKVD